MNDVARRLLEGGQQGRLYAQPFGDDGTAGDSIFQYGPVPVTPRLGAWSFVDQDSEATAREQFGKSPEELTQEEREGWGLYPAEGAWVITEANKVALDAVQNNCVANSDGSWYEFNHAMKAACAELAVRTIRFDTPPTPEI